MSSRASCLQCKCRAKDNDFVAAAQMHRSTFASCADWLENWAGGRSKKGEARDSAQRTLRRRDTRVLGHPGPEVLNPVIPLFFIGRNNEGFWIVREAEAEAGGLLLCRKSAIRFASDSARLRGWEGCATMVSERFELDLANNGDFLVKVSDLQSGSLHVLVSGPKRLASRVVVKKR